MWKALLIEFCHNWTMLDRILNFRAIDGELRHSALLGAVYFFAAFLSVTFTRFEGGVAMIWIATGILSADLRHRPQYTWTLRSLACGFAGMVVTISVGLGPVAAIPLAVINVGEAVLTAWLLNKVQPERGHMSTPREIGMLIVFAGIVVPFISAFPAAATAKLCAGVPFSTNWVSWFAAHALGALTIMPLAKLTLGGDLRRWAAEAQRTDWLEGTLLLIVMASVDCLVFVQHRLPLLFLPFLPLMIAVFRLGRIGAAVGLVMLAAIGSVCTLNALGPINLIGGATGQHIQFLQFYLATAFLMSLLPAAELHQRKQLYAHLADSTALYQVIADRSGDIVLVLGIDGTIKFASPSIRRISGLDPKSLVGRLALDIVLPDDIADVAAMHRRALNNPDETFIQEFRAIRATGEPGWFESHSRAAIDEAGTVTGAVSVIREVSERKARELELTKAAKTDPLTGLLNRRGLEAIYSENIVEASRGKGARCIAMFDLDHFKHVNDRFGHGTGDDVIRAFSAILLQSIRDTDVVARLGGEEFAILLASADLDQARTICDRVRVRFAETSIFTHEQTVSLTVSVGLAQIPAKATLPQAIKLADDALYAAKAAGRNCLSVAA